MADERLQEVDRSIRERGPRPGERYRHYKGGEYEVVANAVFENTLGHLVLYRPVRDAGRLWARTIDDWQAPVDVGGKTVPRFERLEDF